jgi:hypothetical protein
MWETLHSVRSQDATCAEEFSGVPQSLQANARTLTDWATNTTVKTFPIQHSQNTAPPTLHCQVMRESQNKTQSIKIQGRTQVCGQA